MTDEVGSTSAPALHLLLPSGRQTFDDDSVAGVVDAARRAETAGFAGVCVSDHVVLGDDLDGYPYGNFGHAPDAPFLEPLTTLAAIASTTTTLRLTTHVLLAPLRAAPLLAKTAVTLDRLSGGRFELGVGVGWSKDEYAGLGVPFEERGARLDATMAACRDLWADRVAGLHCRPGPTEQGGPPVLFSGAPSARNVRRVVTLGDGWIAPGVTHAEEVATGVARLRPALEAAGRDPDGVAVRAALPVQRDGKVPDLAATLAQRGEFADAGATDVVIPMGAFVRRPADVGPWFALAQDLILTSNNLPTTVRATTSEGNPWHG